MAVSIPRIRAPPVKYYFIDFDISVKLDRTALDVELLWERERSPEIMGTSTVRCLYPGCLYHRKVVSRSVSEVRSSPAVAETAEYLKICIQTYSNLGFLTPMVEAVTQLEPKSRISISRAIDVFEEARRHLSRFARR